MAVDGAAPPSAERLSRDAGFWREHSVGLSMARTRHQVLNQFQFQVSAPLRALDAFLQGLDR